MIYLIVSILLLGPSDASVQSDTVQQIDTDLIALHTTYFEIRDNAFLGADALLEMMESAHYVALGELHNRHRLGELTTALLHHLHPLGYRHFAVETGPYAASKLQTLIREDRATVEAFYKRYASRLFGLYPIPFFIGKTDLDVLEAVEDLGYALWGLDQEFRYAIGFLADELAEINKGRLSADQQQWHRKITSRLYWWHRRAKMFSGFTLGCQLQEYEPLQAYLQSFEGTDDADTAQIVESIHITLHIYCLAEQGKGGSRERIEYF